MSTEAIAVIIICVAAIVYVLSKIAIIEFRSMAALCRDYADNIAKGSRRNEELANRCRSLEQEACELRQTLDNIRAAMGIEEE